MGWEMAFDTTNNRDTVSDVPATCDSPGCGKKIDRGLAYVCGHEPHGGDHGCGLFFCEDHQFIAGKKRDYVQICKRCLYGKPQYTPTPDLPEWLRWKLKDKSWKPWRDENPDTVKEYRKQLKSHTETTDQTDSGYKENPC